jgi:hypothetical protein
MAYKKRTDFTQIEIVARFRAHGFGVFDTHALPNGCDLIVFKDNQVYMIECKVGKRKLKGGNLVFKELCDKHKTSVYVLRSAQDVDNFVKGDYVEEILLSDYVE